MKKVLFAACAVFAITGLQARSIRIDNDMDGKQATAIKAIVRFSNGKSQTIEVPAGRERSVRFPKGANAVGLFVQGTAGAGAGRRAYYRIPPNLVGKKIKVDADFKNGQIQLSHDRR